MPKPYSQVAPSIDVHLQPDWARIALERDVRRALTVKPRVLPPKWFYDARGSALFHQITQLKEYYPTETERRILAQQAATIVDLSGAETLIELGSGTSDKTRVLLDAFTQRNQLQRFVPFDVSEAPLRQAMDTLGLQYPHLSLRGIVGDFTQHLGLLPTGGRRLIAFLGGTIGNFYPEERQIFLENVARTLQPGDGLLLGTDLIKDPVRLVAAYDDPGGVTAEFNLNALHVINRTLGANFDVTAWEHVALWDAEHEWMDLRVQSKRLQSVHVHALDLTVSFETGDWIQTEISTKFRQERVQQELTSAGFDSVTSWTDPAGDFNLSLALR